MNFLNRKAIVALLGICCVAGAVYYVQSRPLYRPSETFLRKQFPNGQKETLEKSDQFIVYSLSFNNTDDQNSFHGYPILGKAELKGEAKDKLLAHFYSGFKNYDEIHPNSCFSPRHGIRAVRQGKTLDLVICFGCLQYLGYESTAADAERLLGDEGGGVINDFPRIAFDKALREAGVDLSSK